MDPQNDLPDLVEDLEVNIDELSTILAPLLNAQLSTTASSLPLLDKAKLYVLAAYSIESLLYSTLQASGVNAKEHAIFRELARLKGYFSKIKAVEDRPAVSATPKAKLDVNAAARFIKHGLAGNEKYDLERAERLAKEKARAQLKARQINKKFDDNGSETVTPKKRDIEEVVTPEPDAENVDQDDEDILSGLEAPQEPDTQSQHAITSPTKPEPKPKKPKLSSSNSTDTDAHEPKRTRQRGKKGAQTKSSDDADTHDDDASSEPARPKRKQRGKKGKGASALKTSEVGDVEGEGGKKRGRGRPRGSGKAK